MIARGITTPVSSRGSATHSSSGQSSAPSIQRTARPNDAMLSVNFSTPLTGPARSERIKQMSNNHPAFEKSRHAQNILVNMSQSFRRMPGISAAEANDIVAQLQEVGQIISQETSQLVDALMNLNLDQEDTDKAIARMSIEANLAKATTDDQAQTIVNLREELKTEQTKKDQAESGIKKMMEDLEDLTADLKKLKDKAERQQNGQGDESSGEENMVKSLDDSIQTLEEQVNKHRTLWVMRHSNPETVARAIESVTEANQDKDTFKSMMPIKREETVHADHEPARVFADFQPPPRSHSVFQPVHRQPPPKFGQLQAGPPRAPSTMPHERRPPGPWGSGGLGYGGRPGSFSNPPSYQGGSFNNNNNRAPSRRGFQNNNNNNNNNNTNSNNNPRYRNDFQQSSFAMQENQLQPPHRPNSSFGFGRDFHPGTPTGQGRGRYGRFHDAGQQQPSLDFGSGGPSAHPGTGPRNAMISRNSFTGSPIHVTEQAVGAWHERIMEFYKVIRSFVEQHASNKDPAQIMMSLPSSPLWEAVLSAYNPLPEVHALPYLKYHLGQENFKACLVTRVIIGYIVNRVWVPGAWTGADPDSTWAIVELERNLARTQGQPSVVRQPLLDRQATIIETILKNDRGSAFIREKIQDTARSILMNLQPFLNCTQGDSGQGNGFSDEAYEHMQEVTDAAWELSSKILGSRLTFDFRFPEVGVRFSAQSMLPIWPVSDPLELQARHYRVALVTTPVITCRNDTGSNISAHSVTLADVICMM